MSVQTDQISMISSNATNSIDWNSELPGTTVTYAFVPAGVRTTAAESLLTFDRITTEDFNAYERAQFNTGLELIENVTNLEFVETTDHESADLRFMLDTDELGRSFLGVFAPPGEPAAGTGTPGTAPRVVIWTRADSASSPSSTRSCMAWAWHIPMTPGADRR